MVFSVQFLSISTCSMQRLNPSPKRETYLLEESNECSKKFNCSKESSLNILRSLNLEVYKVQLFKGIKSNVLRLTVFCLNILKS